MKICFFTSLYPSADMPQYCIFLEQLAKEVFKIADITIVVPNEKECQRIQFNGIEVIYINPQNVYTDFEKIVVEMEFDVVDFHFGSLDLYKDVYKICKSKGIKFVMHFHGLNILRNYYEKHKIYAWLHSYELKHWYKKADAIIGVSKMVSERAKKQLGKKEVYTVYNGVDSNVFYPSAEDKKSDIIRLISVGNLIKIKGHEHLIKACKLLADDGIINFKLDIYGRGVEEERLKGLVNEYGLQKHISFCGYVDYNIIAEKMREADVFVLPSYFEALGCVYLEAMASKCLTIACKNQGIGEIIKDGENGFLVDERDEHSIFTALKDIILNPEKTVDLINKGYDTAMDYKWSNGADELLKVYGYIIRGEG